jgi:hypothetical protein
MEVLQVVMRLQVISNVKMAGIPKHVLAMEQQQLLQNQKQLKQARLQQQPQLPRSQLQQKLRKDAARNMVE